MNSGTLDHSVRAWHWHSTVCNQSVTKAQLTADGASTAGVSHWGENSHGTVPEAQRHRPWKDRYSLEKGDSWLGKSLWVSGSRSWLSVYFTANWLVLWLRCPCSSHIWTAKGRPLPTHDKEQNKFLGPVWLEAKAKRKKGLVYMSTFAPNCQSDEEGLCGEALSATCHGRTPGFREARGKRCI